MVRTRGLRDSMEVGKVVVGQEPRLVVGQAWGRGMVVEVERIPRRVVGCEQWPEEELQLA